MLQGIAEPALANMALQILQDALTQQLMKLFTGLFGGIGVPGIADGVGGGAYNIGLDAFEGGGYTGDAPRSGGLDGKGGFLSNPSPTRNGH